MIILVVLLLLLVLVVSVCLCASDGQKGLNRSVEVNILLI